MGNVVAHLIFLKVKAQNKHMQYACICTEQQKADDTMACGAKTTLRQKVTEWLGIV